MEKKTIWKRLLASFTIVCMLVTMTACSHIEDQTAVEDNNPFPIYLDN